MSTKRVSDRVDSTKMKDCKKADKRKPKMLHYFFVELLAAGWDGEASDFFVVTAGETAVVEDAAPFDGAAFSFVGDAADFPSSALAVVAGLRRSFTDCTSFLTSLRFISLHSSYIFLNSLAFSSVLNINAKEVITFSPSA